jgi:hypothetical protein
MQGAVKVDEAHFGGVEPGLRGGHQKGKKVPVGVAVERREPQGFGRCRIGRSPTLPRKRCARSWSRTAPVSCRHPRFPAGHPGTRAPYSATRAHRRAHRPRERHERCIAHGGQRRLGPQAEHLAQPDYLLGVHAFLERAAAFVGDEPVPPSPPAATSRLASHGRRRSCCHNEHTLRRQTCGGPTHHLQPSLRGGKHVENEDQRDNREQARRRLGETEPCMRVIAVGVDSETPEVVEVGAPTAPVIK